MDFDDFQFGRRGGSDFSRDVRRYLPQIVIGMVAIGLIIAAYSMFYRVEATEKGVVLRFGAYYRTVDPGLQFKLPWPIDKVYLVPVREIQSLEFGFDTERAGRQSVYAERSAANLDVSEMLTGDLNLANVEWIVQYRISDPQQYLFSIGSTEDLGTRARPSGKTYDVNLAVPDTIHDVSESVMRRLVGDSSIDAVLTISRELIATEAKREIQEMLDGFQAGVDIVTVKLQSTSPPEQVRDAFQEVNRARQKKERIVNEAEGERNRQIPAARGKKDQMISEAEGYRDRIIQEKKGEVAAFQAQLAEYEKAADVTKVRLYLEAIEEVLSNVQSKTVIDESVGGVLPLMNLNNAGPTSGNQ